MHKISTSGATTIEKVTDVTKFHINEKRNAAKEGQGTGKQKEDMIHSRSTKKFCEERLSSSISVRKGRQSNLGI